MSRSCPRPRKPLRVLIAIAIAALRDSTEETPVKLELKAPRLQAPSLLLALSVALAALDRDAELALAIDTVGEPDPRLPRDEVPIWLWEYDDMTPRAALPPPADVVRGAVEALAREDYALSHWWPLARQIAAELGPDAARDVLSCMAHVTLPPDGIDAIAWVQRVQLAAALIAARLDGGWLGSLGRMLLLSLARGPVDWSIGAAVVALFAIAQHNPDARAEVSAVYGELLDLADDESCYAHALSACWLALGVDDASLRARLWRMRRACDRAVQRGA